MSIVSEQLQLSEDLDQTLASLHKGVKARLTAVNTEIRQARAKAHRNNDWNHLDVQLKSLKVQRSTHDKFLSQVRAVAVENSTDLATRKAKVDQLLGEFRRG